MQHYDLQLVARKSRLNIYDESFHMARKHMIATIPCKNKQLSGADCSAVVLAPESRLSIMLA